ncbi:MAG TPA: multicopper oxidase domain-containing protein [Candidatus Sulfopaludibacter sp.]|jgi:FtsP/CotA-like multicopper oxidase with cupredoxin domain|nr:multicopper oxidase domain-containing protein [Candidatus Sulfopaludibacter sp.]
MPLQSFPHRRDFLKLAGAAAVAAPLAAQQMPMPGMPANSGAKEISGPEFNLEIAPVTVELAPNRIISTIGYNGSSPGPLLRMKEGVPVTVNVVNKTDVPELVHYHGLLIPADVDGSEEQGTPVVPPRGTRSYRFTPKPAGTRWYHTHAMSMDDLHRGSYTGQFGFLVIEGGSNPGAYDQEHYLALRDWEPYFTTQYMDTDDLDPAGPQPEKPPVLDTRPPGLEVATDIYSINDKALGFGEPIRVRAGQRVMFHFLNASAIENRHIALPGHKFNVVALDGNPVARPAAVDVLMLGPGERIDAWVAMSQPGVWVMGAPEDRVRDGGLGIVIEYANQRRSPQWVTPPPSAWDYTLFGKPPSGPAPTEHLEMIFEKIPRGAGKFNLFTVSGKPYPHTDEFVLKQGTRYRLTFRNRTDDAHPLHLHRHLWEIAEIYGKPTSGVIKDTVVVPMYGRAVVDFTADQPGPALFHCHIQHHMDYGFKALLKYA